MPRAFLVQMPRAEARHLAGSDHGWAASPEGACVQAVREWLHVIQAARARAVTVRRIVAELRPILDRVPRDQPPVRGPLVPRRGVPAPGLVEYLGGGMVRLDEAAISALAELGEDEDFRVTFTDAGPVLAVGAERYLAREEAQALKG